jgi:hypothetical protein
MIIRVFELIMARTVFCIEYQLNPGQGFSRIREWAVGILVTTDDFKKVGRWISKGLKNGVVHPGILGIVELGNYLSYKNNALCFHKQIR